MNFSGKIKQKPSLQNIATMTIIVIASFLIGYYHNDCKHINQK